MAQGFKINGVDVGDKYVSYAEVGADGLRWSHAGYYPTYSNTILVDSGTAFYGFKSIETRNAALATPQYFEAVAVKEDGSLWGWGINVFNDLGQMSTTAFYTPKRIGSDNDWNYATTSGHHTAAVKKDGTLWMMGNNGGKLGLGDTTHRSFPVQVGSLTDWKELSLNSFSSYAIKTDGTLWAWGNNLWGHLGLGDRIDRSSPTQVGSLTNWSQVVCTTSDYVSAYAIKTDGTLWAWGNNSYGQLGLNDLVHRSSPTQVGSLTNWKKVAASNIRAFAIKTDGTLWSWGADIWTGTGYGTLGHGDRIHRSSPTQVGSLTNWKDVSTNYNSACAVKTDGTLWAWGDNSYGQLGLGNSTHRSSPTQVGSLTNWVSASINAMSLHASQSIL